MKTTLLITLVSLFSVASLTAEPVLNKSNVLTTVAKVDPTSSTSNLFIAAKTGDLPSLVAAINTSSDVDQTNDTGTTALMIAAKYGNTHIAKYLVKKGANIYATNNSGLRAVDFARAYQRTEVFEFLLERES